MKTLTFTWLITVALTVAGLFWLPMGTEPLSGIALGTDAVTSFNQADTV